MTLYELTNSTCVQGNICVTVYDQERNLKKWYHFTDQDDFTPRYEDADELEDMEVIYIYPSTEAGGVVWLNIEVETEESE